MNKLQNIQAKSTVAVIITLFLGLTFPVQAELNLYVDGVFSSPDTAIRQGDSATFSVTVSVEGDLPAGEYITDDYFEIYWSINRTSDFYCVYSLGPTTATSINYTFDEGEAYTILCAVSYYYKLDGDEEYTQLWTEAEGCKDVVKVTGIALRPSGTAKTIGDIWVKDDWDLPTVPPGYRDMVNCPSCIIDTGLHTHTATCGTSHADFTYRGITVDTHWDAWTPGPDGTYDPDTFDYGVDLQGTDGVVDCHATVDTSQGSGPITGGDSDVTFTGDGTHSFAVNIDTIGLCGGTAGGSGYPIALLQPSPEKSPGTTGKTPRLPVPAFSLADDLIVAAAIVGTLGIYFIIKGVREDYFPVTADSNVIFNPQERQLNWTLPPTWDDQWGNPGTTITADLSISGGGTGYYAGNEAYPRKVLDPSVSGKLTWHDQTPTFILDDLGNELLVHGVVEITSSAPVLGLGWCNDPPNEVFVKDSRSGYFLGLTQASVEGRISTDAGVSPWTIRDQETCSMRWQR